MLRDIRSVTDLIITCLERGSRSRPCLLACSERKTTSAPCACLHYDRRRALLTPRCLLNMFCMYLSVYQLRCYAGKVQQVQLMQIIARLLMKNNN